jgi:hypothetical protein
MMDHTGFEPVAFRLGIFYSMRLSDGILFDINGLGVVTSGK